MKTVSQKTKRNSRVNTISSENFTRVRDYKRAMRKQFNEMRRNMTQLSYGVDGMPTEERQQVRSMMRTVEATHRRLMKWWGR
jgi:hypothetical protein